MPEWNLTEQDIERVKEDIRPLNGIVGSKGSPSFLQLTRNQTEVRELREQLAGLSQELH